MTTVQLPDWPWQVVRRLAAERGLRVWPVGGAVRDALLKRPIHDWDFAVDGDALGLARTVADALSGVFYPLDAQRGTGRVILAPQDRTRLELDFATLRGADLETDLAARDFTVNAMALDDTGTVVDPMDGQADLRGRAIRATSTRSFQDDPVRLVRAVRMEAEQGFQIEPRTAAWIRRDAALLALSSVERLRDEFVRGMAIPGASTYLQRLDGFNLLPHVVPEVEALRGVTQSPPHRLDVWRHTLATVETVEKVAAAFTRDPLRPFGDAHGSPGSGQADSRGLAGVPSVAWADVARVLGQFAGEISAQLAAEVSGGRDRTLLLKLAALLHDIGKPKTRSQDHDGRIHFYNHEPVGARMAAAWLDRLRFSRAEVKQVRTMVEEHLRPPHLAHAERITRRAIYRYFRATGIVGVEVVLLSLADHLASWGPDLQERRWAKRLEVAETLLDHYFERREETIAPPPLITGHDLMAELGLDAGPKIGRLLDAVREAQAAGEVKTAEQALDLAGRISRGMIAWPKQS